MAMPEPLVYFNIGLLVGAAILLLVKLTLRAIEHVAGRAQGGS